jgi:hypothetical protein
LHDFVEAEVDVFEETLSGRFQQEDLGIVIFMVSEVTAFLTHQLFVHHAISYVVFVMVRASNGIR